MSTQARGTKRTRTETEVESLSHILSGAKRLMKQARKSEDVKTVLLEDKMERVQETYEAMVAARKSVIKCEAALQKARDAMDKQGVKVQTALAAVEARAEAEAAAEASDDASLVDSCSEGEGDDESVLSSTDEEVSSDDDSDGESDDESGDESDNSTVVSCGTVTDDESDDETDVESD